MALRKPHPPIWNGKLVQSCVSPTPEMPKSCVKHCHVTTSCATANSSVSAGGIPRREYVARVFAQKKRRLCRGRFPNQLVARRQHIDLLGCHRLVVRPSTYTAYCQCHRIRRAKHQVVGSTPLRSLDQRNPIEESAVLLSSGPKFGLHILLVANWDAQHTDQLL